MDTTHVRLADGTLERVEHLRARLADRRSGHSFGGELTRSAVLRVAVERGLEVLEREATDAPRARARRASRRS